MGEHIVLAVIFLFWTSRTFDFFAVLLAAFSKGWGIIINHKSHSNRNLNLAALKSKNVCYSISKKHFDRSSSLLNGTYLGFPLADFDHILI